MKIKIQEIPEEGMCLSLDKHSIQCRSESLEIDGPLHGKLSITKQGENFLYIRGVLSTRILLTCGRCLNPFGHPVQSDFYLDYTPPIKDQSGQERCLYGEELNLHFYQGDTLDIDEIIESQLHLETPMAPCCHDNCKGLCPSCGENLNEGPHVCMIKTITI